MMLIRNTSGDRRKTTQHRTASALQPEPSIGGARLRANQQMYIEDDHFARIRDSLYKSFKDGIIEVEQVQVKEGENIRVGVPMESTKREHTNLHGASGVETPQIKADDENEVTPVLPRGPINPPPPPEGTEPGKIPEKKEWEGNPNDQPPQQPPQDQPPQEQSSQQSSEQQEQSEKPETNTEGQPPSNEGQEQSDKPEHEKHEKHRSGKKSR